MPKTCSLFPVPLPQRQFLTPAYLDKAKNNNLGKIKQIAALINVSNTP
ncbi:MAG: hypothetical protein ACKPJQ_11955 [Dolichospermum sp.]